MACMLCYVLVKSPLSVSAAAAPSHMVCGALCAARDIAQEILVALLLVMLRAALMLLCVRPVRPLPPAAAHHPIQPTF